MRVCLSTPCFVLCRAFACAAVVRDWEEGLEGRIYADNLSAFDGRSALTSHEFIVVGAGTAGSVVAARLSEDPAARVLLLEAGPAHGPEAVSIPSVWPTLLGSEVDWGYVTVEQPGLAGAALPYPLGKMLGGSSSINAMLNVRADRSSYDAWAAGGAPGWGYEDLLPCFRRSERAADRDPRYRGTAGPMRPRPATSVHPVALALAEALEQLGYPYYRRVRSSCQCFGRAFLRCGAKRREALMSRVRKRRLMWWSLIGLAVVAALGSTVARAASGDLDTSFGVGGKVTTDFAGFFDEAHGVVIEPDGKIVAAGWTDGFVLNFGLTRYNSDGSLDVSFGSGGKVSTPFAGEFVFGNAAALQSSGKIVEVGGTQSGNVALARYNTDGSLDSGFGVGGKRISDLGSFDSANAVAVQSDGKIVVVGTSGFHTFAIRYTSSGSLDSSFGSAGVVLIDFAVLPFLSPPADSIGLALALQPDGRILMGGTALTGTSVSDLSFDFAVARLNSNGSFDNSFGNAGKVTTTFGTTFADHAAALAVQPDGKIVAAGDSSPQGATVSGPDFALARYNIDGSLDTGFGTAGEVRTDISSDDRAKALVIEADGKLIAGGYTGVFGFPTTHKDFALVRYNTDGSLDTTFGSSGDVTTDFGGGNDEADALGLEPDGRIVAAGFTSFAPTGGDENFALARYLDSVPPSTITVTKHLIPSSDPGRFNLNIDGTTYAANIGDTGTTGQITLFPGNHTISETAGVHTILDPNHYVTQIVCSNGANGHGTSLTVQLKPGGQLTCTITNTRKLRRT